MGKAVLVISLGAALGALLRWFLGMKLNDYFPQVPPGTLAANLVGGYIVGLAVGWLASSGEIAPEWRLFLVTGFCGGLTTFSTFSLEVVSLLQSGRNLAALGAIGAHVGGSLLMTAAGFATWAGLKAGAAVP
jgi:CrcB protein